MKRVNKRGQVTIFIIAGIVLVILAVLFFVFRQGIVPTINQKPEVNPDKDFSSCIQDKVQETVKLISEQGGYVSNKLNLTFQFVGEEQGDISYLCYQQNYYVSCVNQQPMLIDHLKKEIKKNINSDVENCFNKVVSNLKNKGETVQENYRGFDVELYDDRVVVTVDGEISTQKAGVGAKYSGLKSIVYTRLYNLAVVAQEIISQEARFCNFEQVGYMLIYPDYNINKFRTGNSDLIYTITDKKSQERFRFAVRGCIIPPAF